MTNEAGTGRRRGARATAATVLEWVRDITGTLFVVVALFVVYTTWWTNLANESDQADLLGQLHREWGVSPHDDGGWQEVPLSYDGHLPPEAREGDPVYHLRIPAIGVENTVVLGVGPQDLALGAGHYPDSAAPGARGNAAIAGHRIGRGGVFHHLDRLRTCDEIIIETRSSRYVYRVLDVDGGPVPSCVPGAVAGQLRDYPELPGRSIVEPTDTGVVAPVPYTGTTAPPEPPVLAAVLTLTTCHPEFGNTERMVVHAALTARERRS